MNEERLWPAGGEKIHQTFDHKTGNTFLITVKMSDISLRVDDLIRSLFFNLSLSVQCCSYISQFSCHFLSFLFLNLSVHQSIIYLLVPSELFLFCDSLLTHDSFQLPLLQIHGKLSLFSFLQTLILSPCMFQFPCLGFHSALQSSDQHIEGHLLADLTEATGTGEVNCVK